MQRRLTVLAIFLASHAFAATDEEQTATTHSDDASASAENRVVQIRWDSVADAPLRLELPLAGRMRVIELKEHPVLADNYRLIVVTPEGLSEAQPGPVRTLRGSVSGVEGSAVAALRSERGLRALIMLPGGEQYVLERVPGSLATDHVLYRTDNSPGDDSGACGDDGSTEGRVADLLESAGVSTVRRAVAGSGESCIAELAGDADVEFFQRYGESVEEVEAQIQYIVNAVNVAFERDLGVSHVISAIVVRTSEPDPYDDIGTSDLLLQFHLEWRHNLSHIHRDAAFLFTGKSRCGIAQGSVCNDQIHYALSGECGCGPTGLVAHELGHLWGAGHCDCPGYTMTRGGSCALQFHPQYTVPEVLEFRDEQHCLGGPCGGDGILECSDAECCEPHAGPGCVDPECCEAVCECDPYCCDVEWDEHCAGLGFGDGCGAQGKCWQICLSPDNDDCADAIAVSEGSFVADNRFTTTDGPEEVGECDLIEDDIWYLYTPSCTGQASVSICDTPIDTFNTKIVIYEAPCPEEASGIACNDDACGPWGYQSEVEFPVGAGSEYLVRIGSRSGFDRGWGTMLITCEPGSLPGDVDGDGTVGVSDLLIVLSSWGSCAECPADLNGDGVVDTADLIIVLSNWA